MSEFEPLNDDDVIQVGVTGYPKLIDRCSAITQSVKDLLREWPYKKLLERHAVSDAEVLKTTGGQGWQRGKIRIKISVEFCPDEPIDKTWPPPEAWPGPDNLLGQ